MLFFYVNPKLGFGRDDVNLAYQNASIMAEALGVAQIYTGFVCNAARSSSALNKLLGVEGVIHAGMILGMPKVKFSKYIDRKEVACKRI